MQAAFSRIKDSRLKRTSALLEHPLSLCTMASRFQLLRHTLLDREHSFICITRTWVCLCATGSRFQLLRHISWAHVGNILQANVLIVIAMPEELAQQIEVPCIDLAHYSCAFVLLRMHVVYFWVPQLRHSA